MKKRELMVFAGQSNMMGAAVYPPKDPAKSLDSFEYKHNAKRRFGKGIFVPSAHPTGEFSYVDVSLAYSEEYLAKDGKSTLTDYISNTYFCPSMSNLLSDEEKTLTPFKSYSEHTAPVGASLPPLLAAEWETYGGRCAYAHIAKGGVSICHFFTPEMEEEYSRRAADHNTAHGTALPTFSRIEKEQHGAAEYFLEKSRDFFAEAEKHFADEDTSEHILVWIQGESDASLDPAEYELRLSVLWDQLKKIGFTRFFMLRIDLWGSVGSTLGVMDAQERFCQKTPDAYMMTRALSFVPYSGDSKLFTEITDEYKLCRDSAYGFGNPHLNEKAFKLAAARVAANMDRLLHCGKSPLLEEERLKDLTYMKKS
ncbi:MAG: hypothetical protein E7643_03930 [Ruminococcaceae bacterium]|nr:hypothetical protein [Oscillospiraceae bacterium]